MECCMHKYTNRCGTYTTSRYMSVPPDSIACPTLHMQRGNTPLLRAAGNGHAEVARFLLENGSNVEEKDNVGKLEGV